MIVGSARTVMCQIEFPSGPCLKPQINLSKQGATRHTDGRPVAGSAPHRPLHSGALLELLRDSGCAKSTARPIVGRRRQPDANVPPWSRSCVRRDWMLTLCEGWTTATLPRTSWCANGALMRCPASCSGRCVLHRTHTDQLAASTKWEDLSNGLRPARRSSLFKMLDPTASIDGRSSR